MGQSYTAKFSEGYAILDTINPQSTSTTVAGNWVAVGQYNRLVAKLNVGLIAATGTLDFKIEQAKTSGGGTPKALKAITQLPDTSDNVQRWIEVRNEELDVDGGYHWVRISVVGATAASLVSAELLGFVDRFAPVVQPASLVVVP